MKDKYHESVMVREVLEGLHVKSQAKYIDATLGTGGHTLEIMKLGGRVLGVEADPKMLAIARQRIPSGNFVLGNFSNMDMIAKENNFEKVSGILFDLGVSNLHLTSDTRGFSFGNLDDDLDMRLNKKVQGVRASDLLNVLREDQLVELFGTAIEKGAARWIAKRVLESRPINSVGDFLRAIEGFKGKPGINFATLPFLALRIAVNSELDNLKNVLPEAYNLLENGGYLAVISFHSGEDRIVKKFFESYGGGELILPEEEEVKVNPRARSAKLRIIQK